MSGHGQKLTRKQDQAIVALLVEPTIGKAAANVGVAERTLLRWLKDAGFHEAYRAARREAVSRAIGLLQKAAILAVGALVNIMRNTEAPASSRVTAARTVLDAAMRGIELEDLEDRISGLETTVAGRRGI